MWVFPYTYIYVDYIWCKNWEAATPKMCRKEGMSYCLMRISNTVTPKVLTRDTFKYFVWIFVCGDTNIYIMCRKEGMSYGLIDIQPHSSLDIQPI